MPLPSLLCIAFASGIASAIAGRSELRVSPRPALLTRSFAAYAVFMVLLLVPISVYFYVFHGDWYLLYLVDVRRVPSAIALLSFIGHGAIGAIGFLLGSSLARSQRDMISAFLAGLFAVGALVILVVARSRLAVVGSYAQFHRGFGLSPISDSAVLEGAILMSMLLLVGLGGLLARIQWGAKKGT